MTAQLPSIEPAMALPATAEQIERFLATGEADEWASAWPGDDFFARARSADALLRRALIEAVQRRAPAVTVPAPLLATDRVSFTRRKVEPMVRGLFPASEQERVLAMLAESVVFLTPASIVEVLSSVPWRHTAWSLANLYLLSVDAEPLSAEAPRIVGLSEGTTCFVAMDYFETHAPLADFVVHEAAHVFHNCKRVTLGLPATRRREWLLEIAFAKRETFAYACEAYSRLLELADSRAARLSLLDAHSAEGPPPDERVDHEEYLSILRAAAAARNGWKRLLEACSPRAPARARSAGGQPRSPSHSM